MGEFTGKSIHFAALGLTLVLTPQAQARIAAATTQEERLQTIADIVNRGDARLVHYASSDGSALTERTGQDFDRDFDRAFEKAFDKDTSIPA